MTVYEIVLPWHKPPLSLNDRMHWRTKAALTKDVRTVAKSLARSHHLPRGVEFATIDLTYEPPDRRRRDNDNLFGLLKPCLDGIVTDWGLCAGDDSAHILSTCHIGAVHKPGRITLTIEVPDATLTAKRTKQ